MLLELPEELIVHIISFICDTCSYNNIRLGCISLYNLLPYPKIFRDGFLYKSIQFLNNSTDDRKEIIYYLNGIHKKESIYLNNLLSGDIKYWYSDGSLEALEKYHLGKLDGIQKRWYKNESVWCIEEYNNGEKNGTHYYWNQLGRLTQREYYVNDNQQDIQYYWYDNGNNDEQLTFNNNILHGLAYKWDYYGNLLYISNYNYGTLVNKIYV